MSDVNKPVTLCAIDIDPNGVAGGGDDLATLVRHSKGLTRVAANRFWEDRLRGASSASSEQLAQLASLVSQEHKHGACVRAADEHASGQPSSHVRVFVLLRQLLLHVRQVARPLREEPLHPSCTPRLSSAGSEPLFPAPFPGRCQTSALRFGGHVFPDDVIHNVRDQFLQLHGEHRAL